MKPRPILTFLALLACTSAGVGAGWYLRGRNEQSSSQTSESASARTIREAAAQAQTQRAAGLMNTASSGNTAPPAPFKDLSEILALISGVDDMDELGALAMLDALPRLLATDTATTKAMLDALLESDADEETRTISATCLLMRWMLESPEAAVGYSLAHPALLEDAEELQMMGIAYVAKRNPQGAKALAALLPEEQRSEMNLDQMLAGLSAMNDPAAALQSATEGKLDNNLISGLAGMWASRDPAAAAAWVAGHQSSLPAHVYSKIAERYARKDLKAATAWATTLPEGELRNQAMDSIKDHIVESAESPAAAEPMLAQFSPADANLTRLNLWQRAWGDAEQGSPERAAALQNFTRMVQESSGVPGQGSPISAVAEVAHGLAITDPAGAGAWLMSLPQPVRGPGISRVVDEWADKDAPAASEWVSKLPAGPERVQATISLADKISDDDPERAVAWVQTLPDKADAETRTREIYHSWLGREPAAALAALQKLPEADQQRILSPSAGDAK